MNNSIVITATDTTIIANLIACKTAALTGSPVDQAHTERLWLISVVEAEPVSQHMDDGQRGDSLVERVNTCEAIML